MERYTSPKKNNKESIFQFFKNVKRRSELANDRFESCDKKLKELYKEYKETNVLPEDYNYYLEERTKSAKAKDEANESLKRLKKVFIRVGSICLSAVVALIGSVSAYLYSKNEKLEDNISTAIEQIEDFNSDTHYTLESVKDSPATMTDLALDNLKVHLANYYNLPEAEKFRIYANSYEQTIDQPHNCHELINLVEISYDGHLIASYKETQAIDPAGTINVSPQNNIPDPILNAIWKIVDAQRNPDNKKNAADALNIVTQIDVDRLPAIPNIPTIEDNVR